MLPTIKPETYIIETFLTAFLFSLPFGQPASPRGKRYAPCGRCRPRGATNHSAVNNPPPRSGYYSLVKPQFFSSQGCNSGFFDMRKSGDSVESRLSKLCRLKMDITVDAPVEKSCGKTCGDCGKVQVFHSYSGNFKVWPQTYKCITGWI